MRVLAIDPGPECSAWVVYDTETRLPESWGHDENGLVRTPSGFDVDVLAIEHVTHYGSGMPVGQSVFDACIWIGRFVEAWDNDATCHLVTRREVKTYLCGSVRAKDANVRQALLDRYGGTTQAAIGTAKNPGPLHASKIGRSMATHGWSALAVAITFAERA